MRAPRWTILRWPARALGLAITLMVAQVAAAPGFDLVTAAEARREAAAPPLPAASAAEPPFRARGLPALAPSIEFVAPARDAPALTSPLRIELAFKAPPGARIVPASFRLLYGVLKLDLTERVTQHARLSETGVVLERARVPQGTHRVFVRVADDQGRVAEQAVVFKVAAAR